MSIQQRIAEILAAEAAAITAIRVTPEFERAVLALRDSKGKVLTTGMGKAGHIARKFASTLCSTGTPASYVHPGEAAHGDLGLIAPDDCIVAFSTSGKTREVVEMLELGRHIGLQTVIGVTSHADSALRRLSDRDNVPDLMVLDLLLPWVNGFEVLATIREDATLATLPVLVITAQPGASPTGIVAISDNSGTRTSAA